MLTGRMKSLKSTWEKNISRNCCLCQQNFKKVNCKSNYIIISPLLSSWSVQCHCWRSSSQSGGGWTPFWEKDNKTIIKVTSMVTIIHHSLYLCHHNLAQNTFSELLMWIIICLMYQKNTFSIILSCWCASSWRRSWSPRINLILSGLILIAWY